MTFDLTETLVAIAFGLGIMSLLAALYGMVERSALPPRLRSVIHGIVFGLGGVLAMLEPVRVSEGIIFDARCVIVGVAAAFGGGPAALVSALMVSAYRYELGGVGAMPGVIGICLAASMGMLWWRATGFARRVGLRALIALGMCVSIYSVSVLFLPREIAWPIFVKVAPVITVATIVCVVFMGRLIERERAHLRDERYWKASAHTDPLTGLPNRRQFVSALKASFALSAEGRVNALLVIDADHFKRVNDVHGHVGGDAALVHIANVLRRHARESDHLCRLGGEEFALFLPETPRWRAMAVAEGLRAMIEDGAFVYRDKVVPLSVSVGVAVEFADQRPSAANDLFHAADTALYRAKARGRNCVVLADPVPGAGAEVDSEVASG